MSESILAAGDLGMKSASAALESYLTSRGVSDETRKAIINSLEMIYEYVPYCYKQHKNPEDKKVLMEFLITKGEKIAKFGGNENLNCGLAILDLVKSTRTAMSTSRSGNVPLVVITWGLAMLDLIEVGNSCEPAQRAYYEAFLRQSSVARTTMRSSPVLRKP